MDRIELASRAGDWIKYWHAPNGSPDKARYADAADLYTLQYEDPETLWLLILEIHRQDQSIVIQQVLAAGPLEDLLTLHGDAFIDRVEAQARRNHPFAKLLRGVWKNANE